MNKTNFTEETNFSLPDRLIDTPAFSLAGMFSEGSGSNRLVAWGLRNYPSVDCSFESLADLFNIYCDESDRVSELIREDFFNQYGKDVNHVPVSDFITYNSEHYERIRVFRAQAHSELKSRYDTILG